MGRPTPFALALLFTLVLSTAAGCGGDDGLDPNKDNDGDGFTINEGDCDDLNITIFPGANERCDSVDNNCDGTEDEGFDEDNDGVTSCGGDCRDNDPNSNPAGVEVLDGFDNDCDGIPDNHTDQYDDDGDGFSEDQGDCDDSEGRGPFIGPKAVEVQTDADGNAEGLDNDCDGEVDEGVEPCPSGGAATDGTSYADAIDVCDQVASAGWSGSMGISAQSRAIVTDFGSYDTKEGPEMIVLSTGLAGDASLPGFVNPGSGTSFTNQVSHPSPQGSPQDGCGQADPGLVEDYTELKLVLNVPSNARGFSFDFNFMSGEFDAFVCSAFDDTFLAVLQSQAFAGNVSFDAQGNRVSINIGFFDVCSPGQGPDCAGAGDLAGTGYETYGGTGWLTTTAPVVPGEKITLSFMIFDEGDDILDSTVLIDNFRWEFLEIDGPSTIERLPRLPAHDGEIRVPETNALTRAN